ncbi:NAD(P)H-dependent oxidoreductase [Variovorax sp. LjRoot84]|uniref:NAD(P)H-dependent oxidoreductase n=1 Tax=Variovorax sp. LjRoot84 TaxID=3342340 RepID=UPI003ECD42BD
MKDVPEATRPDLEWADGFVLGTPTRVGLPSMQLKQFMDTLGPLWSEGKLQDKAATAFTGAGNMHGGQETTCSRCTTPSITVGSIIVPVGCTDKLLYAAGSNPYGVSYSDPREQPMPAEKLAAARYQGARVAKFAGLLAAGWG